MSIIQLTNVNNQSLPSGVTFSDNTLKLLKKSVFKDTLTIKLNHRELTTLNIVVEPSVEAKLILELNDTDSSDVTYDIDMKLMENSQVKFLLISEVQSNNAKLNFKSSSLADSNMEFIGGFINDI